MPFGVLLAAGQSRNRDTAGRARRARTGGMGPLRRAARRWHEGLEGARCARRRPRPRALQLPRLAAGGRGALLAGREDRRWTALALLDGLRRPELRWIAGRAAPVEVVAALNEIVAPALSQVGPVGAEVLAERAQGHLLLL